MAKILASGSAGRVVSSANGIAAEASNSCGGDACRVKILAPVGIQYASFRAAVPHRQGFPSSFSVNSRSRAQRTTVSFARASSAATRRSGAADVAGTIAPIRIYTAADGNPVQFQDLWDQKNGVALVVFLRHFGCPFCWEFAGQLRDAKSNLDAAGVKLIAIGVGKPDKAQLMAEKINFPIECLYCDDDRKAYKALELPGDARTFFFPKVSLVPQIISSWPSIKEIMSNGYKISAPDDKRGVMQQGGLYIFRGQELVYARKEEHVADHPNLEEVLRICSTIPQYT